MRRVPGEAPLAICRLGLRRYSWTYPDAFYAYAEAGGGEAPAGAKSKPVSGLAGVVQYLRGEDHLRHATLKSVRPIDPKEAMNR